MAAIANTEQETSLSQIPDDTTGEDRLSALPEFLLHEILSMMELKKAVATSLLSRRWRNLWKFIPVIDVGQWRFGTNDRILRLINKSLKEQYCSPVIRAFRVEMDYEDGKDRYINDWLKLASEHYIKELDLMLVPEYVDSLDEVHTTPHYKVPQCLSNCQSLEALSLMFCHLCTALSSPSFCLLKTLELDMVWLSELDTSGCPALESLFLGECNTMGHLKIYAPNRKLETLVIHDGDGVMAYQDSVVTIFAPNVQSIQFKGFVRRAYKINDLSSLKNVSLGFYCFNLHPGLFHLAADSLKALLVKVGQHAPTVKLSCWCIKVLYYWEIHKMSLPPPLKATCLGLETNLKNLLEVAFALGKSQYIKSLTVEIKYSVAARDFDEVWGSLQSSLRAIKQLKIVKINNFLGSKIRCFDEEPEPNLHIDKFLEKWEMEIKLVKVLLNSCSMLEKMHISTAMMPESWTLESELLRAIRKSLLALPRASANAKIYFS